MTSNTNAVIKNLLNKKRMFLLVVISFFALIISFGINIAYAYYHESITSGILANKVGDFDTGDGDINMLIYKENDEGKFTRVYAIPDAFYTFNDELTSCTIPCNDGQGNCEYTYDSVNRNISLTSNQKLSCKFYFEKEASSDINIYVLVEDENGSYSNTYTESDASGVSTITKNYSLFDNVPAYGYEYTGNYKCDSSANVTYNSETKKFSVATATKNTCYVYFNSVGESDVIVNVFVQSAYGSTTYSEVSTIPSNKIYALNETKSNCYDSSGATGSAISYVDGYINISASGAQTCDVYLDLQSN